jgi:hypothetical protein
MQAINSRVKLPSRTTKEQNFKASLQELSNTTAKIIHLLKLPASEITPSALGVRLALFLNHLRQHHTHAVAMGALAGVDPSELVKYLQEMRQLRGFVARWLTIHAAQPQLIFVEISDFESQCWTAMGTGVLLLDNAQTEDFTADCALTSRFHQWWDKLTTRPASFVI